MRINNYKKRIYENRYSCSGQVGQVLAKAFLHEGHEVMLGTRNTAKEEVVKWKTANPKGQTGNFEETAKFGELLVLATGGYETEDLGKVEAARAIEPLCILWCIPGFIKNQWNHAFKLLRK